MLLLFLCSNFSRVLQNPLRKIGALTQLILLSLKYFQVKERLQQSYELFQKSKKEQSRLSQLFFDKENLCDQLIQKVENQRAKKAALQSRLEKCEQSDKEQVLKLESIQQALKECVNSYEELNIKYISTCNQLIDAEQSKKNLQDLYDLLKQDYDHAQDQLQGKVETLNKELQLNQQESSQNYEELAIKYQETFNLLQSKEKSQQELQNSYNALQEDYEKKLSLFTDLEFQKQELEQKLDSIGQNYEELNAEYQNTEQSLKELQNSYNTLQKDYEKQLSQFTDLEIQKQELQQRLDNISPNYEELNSKYQNTEQSQKELQNAYNALQEDYDKQLAQFTDLEIQKQELQQILDNISQNYNELNAKYQNTEQQQKELQNAYNTLQEDYDKKLPQFTDLKIQQQELQQRLENISQNYNELNAKYQNTEQSQKELQNAYNALQDDYYQKLSQFTDLEAQKQELQQRLDNISQNYHELNAKYDTTRNQLSAIKLQKMDLQIEYDALKQDYQDSKTQLNSNIENQINDIKILSRENYELQNQLLNLSSQNEELKNELSNLIDIIEHERSNTQCFKEQFEKAEAGQASNSFALSQIQTNIRQAGQSIYGCQNIISKMQTAFNITNQEPYILQEISLLNDQTPIQSAYAVIQQELDQIENIGNYIFKSINIINEPMNNLKTEIIELKYLIDDEMRNLDQLLKNIVNNERKEMYILIKNRSQNNELSGNDSLYDSFSKFNITIGIFIECIQLSTNCTKDLQQSHKSEVRKLNLEINKLNEDISQLMASKNEMQIKVTQMEQEAQSIQDALDEKIQQYRLEVSEKVKLTSQLGEVRAENEDLQRQISELSEEIDEIDMIKKRQIKKIKDLEAEKQQLLKQIASNSDAQTNAIIQNLNESLQKAHMKIETQQEQLKIKESEFKQIANELFSKTNELLEAQTQIEDLQKENKALSLDLGSFRASKLHDDLEDKEQQVSENLINQKINSLQLQLDNKTLQTQELEQICLNLRKQAHLYEQLKSKVQEIAQKIFQYLLNVSIEKQVIWRIETFVNKLLQEVRDLDVISQECQQNVETEHSTEISQDEGWHEEGQYRFQQKAKAADAFKLCQ